MKTATMFCKHIHGANLPDSLIQHKLVYGQHGRNAAALWHRSSDDELGRVGNNLFNRAEFCCLYNGVPVFLRETWGEQNIDCQPRKPFLASIVDTEFHLLGEQHPFRVDPPLLTEAENVNPGTGAE